MTEPATTPAPAPAPAPAKPSVWKRLVAFAIAWLRSPQGRRDVLLAATAAYTAAHRAGIL